MSGHLCLKWNNHSSAFLKSISDIQTKERYCDATIACQGKYFSVHRIILSTCSDYFDEIFERMECQHPYIIFKDIDPNEMELLLNYMYQGEVNVVQEKLPVLIKAAEALRIKGLSVPGEVPLVDEPYGKRSILDYDCMESSMREGEERKKRKKSNCSNSSDHEAEDIALHSSVEEQPVEARKQKLIKEEPLDTSDYGDEAICTPVQTLLCESGDNSFGTFMNFPIPEIKLEKGLSAAESFEAQCASWGDFGSASLWQNFSTTGLGGQNEMTGTNLQSGSGLRKKGEILPKRITLSKKVYTRSHQKCPYCEYTSYWSTNVKEHIMFKHTGERPIHCSFCTKRFIAKKYLQIHMRTHTGEKPFECPNCAKQFSQKGNLATHMGRKHQCVKQA